MPLVGLVLVGATGKEIIRPALDQPSIGTASQLTGPERRVPSPHSVEAERLMTIDLTPVHPTPSEPSPAPAHTAITASEVVAPDEGNDGGDGTDDDSDGARDQRTPVHHQGVTGDPGGEIRGEEERGAGDVRGFPEPA